jgi:hypothetical protein
MPKQTHLIILKNSQSMTNSDLIQAACRPSSTASRRWNRSSSPAQPGCCWLTTSLNFSFFVLRFDKKRSKNGQHFKTSFHAEKTLKKH